MDNLTHSLIGAALGQAGLKRKTGLAMPALIIGANLPDIDAGCVVYGVESLAMRRGITHGPIAMVLLPLLLAGGLWWFDKWQDRRGTRPRGRAPVHFGWLYALSLIACLTHPLFDWFNNYGVRLLEPFSHQWFYGDTLFIIDPWIIAMLGWGIWYSLRRERAARARWRWPSEVALAGVAAYVMLNMAISSVATTVAAGDVPYARTNVASAVPLAFWRRDVLWRSDDGHYGSMLCTGTSCRRYPLKVRKVALTDPRIAEWSKNDPAAQAFLFWSRMPIAELHDDRIILRDQRFMDPRTAAQFSVTLRPPR
jgi:inner membrane protein